MTADDGGEIAWGKRTVVNVAEVLSSDDDDNGWGRTVMEFIEHCRAKGFDMGEKTNWRSLGADTGKGPQGPPGVLERTASPTSLHKGQEWVLTAVKNPGRLSITYRVEARLMKEMAQDMSGSYRSVRHTSPSFPSFFLSLNEEVFLTGVDGAQFIKVTCRADSVLAVLDPFFMRCHFGSFTKGASTTPLRLPAPSRKIKAATLMVVFCRPVADLNRKLAELQPAPIRRSSNAGLPSPLAQRDQQTLQATPAPPTEQKIGTGGSRKESAATAAEADPTPEADVEVVPEVAAVSSEQQSAQEGGPGVPESPMPGSMDAQP